MNQDIENTGARRLRTIIDNILEEINFNAEKYRGQEYIIESDYINKIMEKVIEGIDLKKFIL